MKNGDNDRRGVVAGDQSEGAGLSPETLSESKVMAVTSSCSRKFETIGLMAAGIVHELNNYLGVIGLCAETIEDQIHDWEFVRAKVKQILHSQNQACRLGQRILEYAKKSTRPAEEPISLTNAVSGFSDLLELVAGEKIDFKWEFRDHGLLIKASVDDLHQILLNLVLNAKDAMPEGGTLTTRTYGQELDGQIFGVIEVADTGEGIAPESVPTIFEPYISSKGDCGTGLGLAVVADLVSAQDGKIEVSSTLGEGTVFRVSFPGISQ